jgi:hypothetical protein
MNENMRYAFEANYELSGSAGAIIEVVHDGHVIHCEPLESTGARWHTIKIELEGVMGAAHGPGNELPHAEAGADRQASEQTALSIRRWPGTGDLTIQNVRLLGEHDTEQGVFEYGSPMFVIVAFTAQHGGRFPVLPSLTIYRRCDGVVVTQNIGEPATIDVCAGETREARLDLGPLNLGNGEYVLSVALFRTLDLNEIDEPQRYDLIDRSYEFRVYGRPQMMRAVFQHPGTWRLIDAEQHHFKSRSA